MCGRHAPRQDSVSRSAVRSAVDESLLDKDTLAMLHRVFYDGCMKANFWGGHSERKRRAALDRVQFVELFSTLTQWDACADRAFDLLEENGAVSFPGAARD